MQTAGSVFTNTRQHRPRAGWRLLIHLVLFVAITAGRDAIVKSLGGGAVASAMLFTAWCGATFFLTGLLARFVDRRNFDDYGFHLDGGWWMDLAFGVALGGFLMTGIFLTARVAGWVSVTGYGATSSGLAFVPAFLLRIVAFAAVAASEELAFRGYQIRNLAEGFAGERRPRRRALVWAFVASAAFFGLGHATNTQATIYSTVTTVISGLMIALPLLLTGELGAAIGLHFAWNLFQGPVYGFSVSGSAPATHLFVIDQTGPVIWTGGTYGPEVGLLGLGWALIGCVLMLAWVKWRRGAIALCEPLAVYVPRPSR